jgi:hypothetical protein
VLESAERLVREIDEGLIEDADLCGFPVEGRDDDFDDELTVEALDEDQPQP